MGILDTPNTPDTPVNERIAKQIVQQARLTFQQLANTFNQGAQTFWRNPRAKPSEIAAALGADAKEVFELHGKIGALIATVKPESIAAGAAVVGQFTYNQDGTVTVVDPE